MPEYEFDDANDAFAEAERRIQVAVKDNAIELELGGLGITVLPPSIGEVPSLRILSLDRNRLTSLPESVCRLCRTPSFRSPGGGMKQSRPG